MKSGKIAVALQSFENPKTLTLAPRGSEGRYPPSHLWQDSISWWEPAPHVDPELPDPCSLKIGEFPKR